MFFYRFVPAIEPIDLINVAFEQKKPISNPTNKRKSKPSNMNDKGPNFDVPDRITGRSGLKELANINPSRQWRLIEVRLVFKVYMNSHVFWLFKKLIHVYRSAMN